MQPAYSWFRKPWPFTCQRLREKSQESILICFSFVSIPLQTSVPHQCCNPVNPSALHFDAQPSPISIWGAAELDTDGDKRDFWHVLAKNNRRVILSVKKKAPISLLNRAILVGRRNNCCVWNTWMSSGPLCPCAYLSQSYLCPVFLNLENTLFSGGFCHQHSDKHSLQHAVLSLKSCPSWEAPFGVHRFYLFVTFKKDAVDFYVHFLFIHITLFIALERT